VRTIEKSGVVIVLYICIYEASAANLSRIFTFFDNFMQSVVS